MKVLLLGGTGILSTEICKLAIQKSYEVTILNRGRRKAFINQNAELIIGDLREESIAELHAKLGKTPFDVVVDFISYNEKQLQKTLQIISGFCSHYIFISSATVYFDQGPDAVYTEDSPIGNDTWQYAFEKAKCEQYLRTHQSTLGFVYSIIRPYVTYGITRLPYQILPIEYYSIINRILTGRSLPICGDNVKTTLTDVRDFAIGAVGMFLNEKAYSQVVHITANETITWKEAAEQIALQLHRDVKFVDLPISYLKKNQWRLAINVNEILGDKGRNMVFNNAKIKRIVPEYTGEITFAQGITDSLVYFMSHKEAQTVNDVWDDCVDRMLCRFGDKEDIQSVKAYRSTLPAKRKLISFLKTVKLVAHKMLV